MKSILVIPFYKNENYIDNFSEYFNKYQSEKNIFEKIYIINDCPTSEGSEYLRSECAKAGFEFLQNDENLGFLKTVNIGFDIARKSFSNLIILNSDTLPYADSFKELLACLMADPMLGCVAPRSNNATICNISSKPVYLESEQDFIRITALFERTKNLVPQITYSPVTNGFAIAIRSQVIQSFGGYSEVFDPGYEEENEYCLRVSAHGYKIGIANHSFIGHLEGRSFGLKEGRSQLRDKNHAILLSMCPYYYDLLALHSDTYEVIAYSKLISAFQRGEGIVLVDGSTLSPLYNGTNKLIVEFSRALTSLGYAVHLVCNLEAFNFHSLNNLPRIVQLSAADIDGQYLVGVKIGQPFDHGAILTIPDNCIYAVDIFFDTIALDCSSIRAGNPHIYGLWASIGYLFSHISFISAHSKKQFELRFASDASRHYADLLPIDLSMPEPMTKVSEQDTQSVPYALVIGNKFKHKGLENAWKQLPTKDNFEYVILGAEVDIGNRSDVKIYPAGEIEKVILDSLFLNCKFVILPSYAEGFGYSLLEALSYKKKIYVRDIPCYREIQDELDYRTAALIEYVENFDQISFDEYEAESVDFDNQTYEDYVSPIMRQAFYAVEKNMFSDLCRRIQFLRLVSPKPAPLPRTREEKLLDLYGALYQKPILRPFLKLAKLFYFGSRRLLN